MSNSKNLHTYLLTQFLPFTLLLNCVMQTNTDLLKLELNDSGTSVSRTVYLK